MRKGWRLTETDLDSYRSHVEQKSLTDWQCVESLLGHIASQTLEITDLRKRITTLQEGIRAKFSAEEINKAIGGKDLLDEVRKIVGLSTTEAKKLAWIKNLIGDKNES